MSLAVLLTPAATRAATADSPGRLVSTVLASTSGAVIDEVRCAVEAPDGTLVVGSNSLAIFDGYKWQTFEVGDAYAFRALAPVPGSASHRVWVGAIGELGYLERDGTGRWHYTSLRRELAASGMSRISDVWAVCPLGDGAAWITSDHVLRWTPHRGGDGHFETWRLPSLSRLALFGGGSEVFVHQEGSGLLKLGAAGPPERLVGNDALPQGPMNWMAASAPTALVGIGNEAYQWDRGATFTRLDALSAMLADSLPTGAAVLADGRVAIGTFRGGLVLAAATGEPLGRYGTDDGLLDASMYSVHGHDGRLWIASPAGLSRIDEPGHAEFFERHRHLHDGRPIKALDHQGETFLLTSSGLFRERRESNRTRLETVLSPGAPLTDAVSIGSALWVSGFGGLWRIAGAPARQEHFTPTDVARVGRSAQLASGVLFIEDYRLKALVPSPHGSWAARDLGAKIADTPVSLLETPDGDIWVSTVKDGISRFRWVESASSNDPTGLRLIATYRSGAGLPVNTRRAALVHAGNQLFAVGPEQILTLRPDQSSFEPAAFFGDLGGVAVSTTHWIVRAESVAHLGVAGLLRLEPGAGDDLRASFLDIPGLDTLGAVTTIEAPERSGGGFWIGAPQGWLRVAAPSVRPARPPGPVRIRSVAEHDARGAPRFAFADPAAANGGFAGYQTRLSGVDEDWGPASREPERTFTGLGPGRYELEVRSVDRFGRASPVESRTIVQPAPWWRTAPALATAAGLLVAAVLLVTRWRLARLERLNARLNRLVTERTREIELGSTAKSNFLENISHEIRNPLNGLTGLLGLLKEDRLDPREREITRSLKSVAATLGQVLEEVLEFSKLEYGYGHLNPRAFSLRGLLGDVRGLFTAQARQAGCDLNVVWPGTLADGFEGDPDKIKTILGNFVSNALKYAPHAPIELRAETTGETDGLVDLYLEVVDRGPGIPPEEQELIFKKFVRGRQASHGVPGTGLGLATCRALAKMMNGSVGVESVPGLGSTFYLKLLLPRAAPPAEPALPKTAGPIVETAGERWLIVEDEPYNRTVLEGIALELGVLADCAATAEEAKRRAATQPHTVVLLDWELPDANGGEVARTLRQQSGSHRPVLVAMTGHDSAEIRQRCRDAGIDGFLLKPYDATKVAAAIAHARTRSVAGDDGPQPRLAPARPEAVDGELDLRAFEHYARARAQDPLAAKRAYVHALDAQAAALASAISARKHAVISAAAHRLRGLGGMVRATELNQAAQHLEDLARGGAADYEEAWQHMRHACEVLKQKLS